MAGRLKGKVAVITGSTRGIGEGIARLFAEEGANVVVTGRTREAGEKVARSIRDGGGSARFLSLDLQSEDSVRTLFEDVASSYPRLDILINNAAPTEFHGWGKLDDSLDRLSLSDWQRLTKGGLDGFFLACRYALPLLVASGSSSMVNISSVVSIRGFVGMDNYTASKGAINALSRSIAMTYVSRGLRCNTIVVGGIETPGNRQLADEKWQEASRNSTPMRRKGSPRDIAYACVYLASDESRFVTGTSITIDGGKTAELAIPSLGASGSDASL